MHTQILQKNDFGFFLNKKEGMCRIKAHRQKGYVSSSTCNDKGNSKKRKI